jgi:hypothetical protein
MSITNQNPFWGAPERNTETNRDEYLRDDARPAAEYKHVAFEVPLGSAQIKYFARCDQWVPRSGVLRCLILNDAHGQLVVKIDEQELRLKTVWKFAHHVLPTRPTPASTRLRAGATSSRRPLTGVRSAASGGSA